MTTSDNTAAIEKALEGVTPGRWTKCGGATPYYTAIHSDHGYIIFGMADGQVHKEHGRPIKAPSMWEQQANAAYIAACNPVAISALLAEARKAEAMKQEIAELRAALKPFARYETADGLPCGFLRVPDEHPILFNVLGDETKVVATVGDFRRAAAIRKEGERTC